MGNAHKYIILAGLLVFSSMIFGQTPELPNSSYYNRITDLNPRYYTRHDTVWVYSGICKTLKITTLTGQDAVAYLNGKTYDSTKSPFLKIHGNIQYNFTYRSFVDTPFSQTDFAQHSLQTSLDFVIRDHYPVKVILLSRRSNSPYFNNMTDVAVQFNRGMFLNDLKENLNKKIPGAISMGKLPEAELAYNRKQWAIEGLQAWLNHPARLQEIMEEKERWAAKKAMEGTQLPGRKNINEKITGSIDSAFDHIDTANKLKTDSLTGDIKTVKDSTGKFEVLKQYEQKQMELKNALQELKSLDKKVKSVKKSILDSISMFRQQLAKITDAAALKDFIREHKLDAKDLPKGWQTLSAINTIGIGRTWIDYSELTVKNISLTGINAEITPSRFYFAFAAGRINYRFRDFVIKNNHQPRQSLYLVRAGVGKKDGNNFILTWYDGKRNLLNPYGNLSATNQLEKVIGISAQSRLQVNSNTFLTLEVARSSFHTTGTVNQDNKELIKKVWNLRDRSNEAYSISLSSYWPQTNTKFSGYYRKMGEHFQSFNLQPVNADQEAYQLRVQQSLWKRKLSLEAGIRKNDFSNVFINPGLSSKTIFKSVQATLRIPKYPMVSVGYYPSSQLTVLDNNVIVENQYNTLSTIINYGYRVKNLSMTSNMVYLKFYNSGADTGFIYYNASSITLNQYLFWNKFQLQSGLTFTSQRDLDVLTLEQSASYQVAKWFTLSGALKYNRVNHSATLWGGGAGASILLNRFGTVQLSYDKSYFPGQSRNLLPVDMGRMTYTRTF
jgi:hypothetical protein